MKGMLLEYSSLIRGIWAETWMKWVKHARIWKNVSGRGKGKCKGPEEMCLVHLQNSEKTWVAGQSKRRGEQVVFYIFK